MTTNRLAKSTSDKALKVCPPDMPRGDSPDDKAARERYWIERGNRLLAEARKYDLHWVCINGIYWIEDGPPPRALLATQPTASGGRP